MKLISVRPYIWIITSRAIVDASCRGERRGRGRMASVFAAFSRRLPTRYGWGRRKGRFWHFVRDASIPPARRRDRTRASASIWHRRWIFIRVQADIRSGAPVRKRKFRATRTHKGLPERERERAGKKDTKRERESLYASKWYRHWRVHVASDILSATKRWYFRLYQWWQTISEFLRY